MEVKNCLLIVSFAERFKIKLLFQLQLHSLLEADKITYFFQIRYNQQNDIKKTYEKLCFYSFRYLRPIQRVPTNLR